MTRPIRILGATLLAALLLAALLAAGGLAIVGMHDPALIEINGEPLARLGALHGLLAVAGAGLVLLVVLFVVLPVALLLPLVLVALLLFGAFAAVAGVLTLLLSPLLLLVGGVWLILRLARGGAKRRAGAGATIAR